MTGVYVPQADLVVGDDAGAVDFDPPAEEPGVLLVEGDEDPDEDPDDDESEEVLVDGELPESLDGAPEPPETPDSVEDFSPLEEPESSPGADGVVLDDLPRLSFL